MATYVMLGRYSAEALQGISAQRTKEGNDLAQKFGGRIKEIYALMGKIDLLVIAEFPGAGAAVQFSVALSRMTGIAFATSEALPAAQFDELMEKL